MKFLKPSIAENHLTSGTYADKASLFAPRGGGGEPKSLADAAGRALPEAEFLKSGERVSHESGNYVEEARLANRLRSAAETEQLKEQLIQNDYIDKEESPLKPKTLAEQAKEQEEAVRRAMAGLRAELSRAGGNAASEVIARLAAAGISVDKVGIAAFNEACGAALANPSDPPPREAMMALREVEAFSRKIDGIRSLDEAEIANIVRQGRELTVENIYAGKFSAAEGSALPKETVDALMPEIEKRLRAEHIEPNREHMEAARRLAAHEIAINEENIEKYTFLKNIGNEIAASRENLIKWAYLSVQNGDNPNNFKLQDDSANLRAEAAAALNAKYEEMLDELPKIEPRHIDTLIFSQTRISISISSLQVVYRQGGAGRTGLGGGFSAEAGRAMETLSRIRALMTLEAARRLAYRNIDISRRPLALALEELERLSAEDYRRALADTGTAPRADCEEAISETVSSSLSVRVAYQSEYLYFSMRQSGIDIASAKTTAEISIKQISVCYEANSTVVSAKYGDSFAAVSDDFKDFLEKSGLDSSESAIRAAKILSRAEMDINYENLENVKFFDGKLRRIIEGLNPRVAAEIIKKGVNPARISLDELESEIDAYDGEYGENTEEKLLRYLSEPGKSGISDEVRDAVVAVYRMLDKIRKFGAAGLGISLKTGAELTLARILEASRLFAKGAARRGLMDSSVGGEFSEKKADENGILPTLDRTAADRRQSQLAAEILRKGAPAQMERLFAETPDFEELTLEKLLDKLKAEIEKAETAARGEGAAAGLAERVSSLRDISGHLLSFIHEAGLPFNMANLEALRRMERDGKYSELARLKRLFADEFRGILPTTALREIAAGQTPEELLRGIAEKIEGLIAANETDVSRIESAERAARSLGLERARLSEGFSFPMEFAGEISEAEIFVLNSERLDESANVVFSLTTRSFGRMEINLKTEFSSADVEIFVGSAAYASKLGETGEGLKQAISAAGYEVRHVKISVSSEIRG